MDPGDTLFLHGSLVHGSAPNTTTDRFRRSLIGHYILADARQVAEYYHPALHMDGSLVELHVSEGGGARGEWIEHDGVPVAATTGTHTITRRHEQTTADAEPASRQPASPRCAGSTGNRAAGRGTPPVVTLGSDRSAADQVT
jgi:ectoine hydroxylase-related dioxygenase (phytanoyl-CoA dioxygenase family)